MTTTGPIVLTGPDRSGTTLLYALVGSHPDVAMVRRTNLWRWFDRRFGDLSVAVNLDRCLDAMLRYRRLDVLALDPDRVREAFDRGPATYGHLFDIVHRQHAERHHRSRWADKSLHTEFAADRVLGELPDARMIHMVRDPRDRYASIIRRYDERTKGPGAIMGRWLASEAQGRRNQVRHAERYRVVRYETLATAPEATLRGICAFLDLPYASDMLRMDGVVGDANDRGNSSFGAFEPGTVSTRSIGRFRSVLSPRQIAFVQACAGRRMAAHGYALEAVRLSGHDRAAFFGADAPLGVLRVAGWTATQRVARRANRGVPTHRLRQRAAA